MLAAKSEAKFIPLFISQTKIGITSQRWSNGYHDCIFQGPRIFTFTGAKPISWVDRILDELPPPRRSLGLAVFDPWGWDFSFSTLADITKGRRLDLVVNFPIGYIKRNWEKDLPRLDDYMNGDAYRGPFRAAMRRENPGETPARALLDAYAEELQKIGYNYIRDNRVRRKFKARHAIWSAVRQQTQSRGRLLGQGNQENGKRTTQDVFLKSC